MSAIRLLRLASVLTFLHAVLHSIGSLAGTPQPGAQQTAVLAMQTYRFPVMGAMRSFWDFQTGLNIVVGLMLLVEAVVFWQLSSLAKTDAARLRPILVTFGVGYLCLAVVTGTYFFAAPALIEVIIALCLGMAALRSRAVGGLFEGGGVRQPVAR